MLWIVVGLLMAVTVWLVCLGLSREDHCPDRPQEVVCSRQCRKEQITPGWMYAHHCRLQPEIASAPSRASLAISNLKGLFGRSAERIKKAYAPPGTHTPSAPWPLRWY